MPYRAASLLPASRRPAAPVPATEAPRGKDFFDKVATLTIPFVTLVLGLLGAYATATYNNASLRQQKQQAESALLAQRQQAEADRALRADQQKGAQRLAETEALERLLPLVTSTDAKKRLFGYEMFATMGRGELAARLSASEGDAAIPLLRRLQQDADPRVRAAANRSLAELLAPANRGALIGRYESASGRALSAQQRGALDEVLEHVRAASAGLSPREAAYVLATIEYETGGSFKPVEERGTAEALNARYSRLPGNDAPGDGYRYRGRGYAGLTGKANYAAMNRALSLGGTPDDLVANPDRAMDARIGFRIMAQFTFEGPRGLQAKAALARQPPDYARARRVLAGGAAGLNQIVKRAQLFECLLGDEARCG